MTTATKERKAAAAELLAANAATARESHEKYRQELAAQYARESAILDEIVAANPTLEPAHLTLSVAEMAIAEQAAEREWPGRRANVHDVCLLLQRHRATAELRERFGDPSILAAAKKRLTDAVEAERATAATLTDLEVTLPTPNDPGPTLAKQITRLSAKLDSLIATRQACEAEVRQIETARAQLRSRAPDWLKNVVDRELSAARRQIGCFRELSQLNFEIERLRSFEKLMANDRTASGSPMVMLNSQETAYNAAKLFCPEAIGAPVAANRIPAVDVGKLVKFSEDGALKLRAELEARRAPLVTQCDQVRAQIEAPLDRFVAEGVV